MKKWRAFLLPILILALIGISLVLIFDEPQYQGRPLTFWLQQAYSIPLDNPKN